MTLGLVAIFRRKSSIFWSRSSFSLISFFIPLEILGYIGKLEGALDLREGILSKVGVLATEPGK